MAIEKVIDIKVQGNADQAVGSLRSQLKEAQADVAALSDKFGATSQEAINAAKRAGELKDKIGDAKALTDAFNPDAKFKALSSSLGGVAGGFAAVQGGMALFGKQSEDVEKTLLKVQSAMALSAGLQSIGESIDSFKQLGAVVKSYSIVQKAITAGQWLWNAAMAANPIGAIIAGIAALIAAGVALTNYFISNAEASDKNSAAIKENSKALKNEIKAATDNSKAIEINNNHKLAMAKASGQSAEAIRKLELKLIDEQIAYANSSREIAKNTYEKNKNILASLKANDADEEQIKSQEDLTKNSLDNFGKQTQYLRDSVDKKKEIQLRHQVEIRQTETDHNQKLRDKAKEAAEKAREDLKEQKKKDLEDLKSALKAQKDAQQNAQDEITQAISDAQDKQNEFLGTAQEAEEQKVKDKYFRLLELAQQQNRSEEELNVLKDARANELNDIKKTAQDEKAAVEKAVKDKKDADDIQAETNKNEAIANSKKNLDNIMQGIEASGLSKSKAGQAISKAIALTQIGIDSAVAISKASTLANAEGVAAQLAFPMVPAAGTIARVVSYASTAASVISNITRAKQLLSSGGASGGGGGGGSTAPSGSGGGGGGGMTAPQFNIVGNTGVNQLAQTLGQEQAPIKTYVTAGDVTTGQSLNRNIITNASLG
jgi:hypothetical protein